MLGPEARETLATKRAGEAQQPARVRPLTPAREAESAGEPVRTEAGSDLAAQVPRLIPGGSEEGLDEPRRGQAAELPIKARADQQRVRSEGSQTARHETPAPIRPPSSQVDGKSEESVVAADDGASAFFAQVLNLVTLNTWLPAALATGSLAVLLQFRSAASGNVLDAIQALTADPVRVLFLMIPPLIIAAVVMQAFSFEAIRALEGYWRRRGPASFARTLMIRRHVRRKEAIIRRRHKASEKAFYAAKPQMLRKGIPSSIVNAFEAQVLGIKPPRLTDEESTILAKMNWRSSCEAWRLAGIDHLITEERAYPATYRVLPTKLGNLIRATEDRLHDTSSDLEGFALRRHATVPRRVQMQHDRFRNRLGMFSTLVFVCAALMVLTPIILLGSGIGATTIVVIASSFAALGMASYLAALASASGYCVVLRQMDEAPRIRGKG